MSRRLLGPVGWPVAFLLVAALVFAGLGWVTHSALSVERAQREAHARAEVGNTLRDALWRLDGRVLLSLGVEDSRPVYHYDSADPSGPYGPAATPLLVATLPEWMKLHFQLDPAGGWRSNQAPDSEAEAERIRETWGGLPLRNFYGDRETVLGELREKFPAGATCEVFAARDRAAPPDSPPLTPPLFAENGPGPQSEPNPSSPSIQPTPPNAPVFVQQVPNPPAGPEDETFRLLGYDLCPCPPDAKQQAAGTQQAGNSARPEQESAQKKAEATGKQPPPQMQNPTALGNRGGRATQKDTEFERGWNDYQSRVQTFRKGLEEAKGAYDGPNGRGMLQNYSQNTLQLDPRNNANLGQAGPRLPPVEEWDRSPGGTVPPGAQLGGGGFNPRPMFGRADGSRAARGPGAADELPLRPPVGLLAGLFDPARQRQREQDAVLNKLAKPTTPPAGHPGRQQGDAKPVAAVIPPPPAEVRPTPPVPAFAPVPGPVPLHLGSMRPQWVTAPDGSEMLVLVRSVRFDTKTVYQGVVLDWAKLQDELKAQVQDLFPDARLVPVRGPEEVVPGRAMASLPVQLDPGPEPELPPAGGTPLRLGLVLAWAAAVIAVVAVGFSGWSLIDLAERRIRFVSAVTHELRTPLTSLRLYLDLLVSGMIRDEAKRQEYLNTLATESDRLHRLIDNVLDFARLEKRRKDGDVKPVRVAELLDQLRATWTDRVAQDGKELVVMSMLPPECEVNTDPAMVQQIVGNLIDNARKYTRDAAEKRIWVWARPGRGRGVVLEVEDRGPGVPAGERRGIFKPFRRGTQADARAGGAGLGLALAKSWAEVLGGRLTYRPADGGTGACFRLELPGK